MSGNIYSFIADRILAVSIVFVLSAGVLSAIETT